MSISHDLHRRRRRVLEPFFSRHGVRKLEAVLFELVMRLESRMKSHEHTNSVVNLRYAFTALSGDVIRRICTESKENLLDEPDFAVSWYVALPSLLSFPLIASIRSADG